MTERRKKRLQEVVSRRQQGILVLEDIHDPHNSAACFRSADGFGFQTVYLIFRSEKKCNPKKVGKVTSSSANKWLNFKIYASTETCLRDLKKQGYETIATVIQGKGVEDFSKAKLVKPKIALLLGNEHRGLSEIAIRLADRRMAIPMQGLVESFNLSVTAALGLYEITRQRIARGMKKYVLSVKNQKRL